MKHYEHHLRAIRTHIQRKDFKSSGEHFRSEIAQKMKDEGKLPKAFQSTGNMAVDALIRSKRPRFCYGVGAHTLNYPGPQWGYVVMPPKEAFYDEMGYRHTFMHEMSHREARLRDNVLLDCKVPVGLPDEVAQELARFSPEYILEEVAAELSAGFVCAELDPENAHRHLDWSACYIDHYLNGHRDTPLGAGMPSWESLLDRMVDDAADRADRLLGRASACKEAA